jgi:hypothetical protein
MNTRLLFLLMFLGMEAEAQSVWNKTYIDDRPVMVFSSVVYNDTSYIVSGASTITGSNSAKALLGNIDLSAQLNECRTFVDSNNSSYGIFTNALIKTPNGKLAFTGYTSDSLYYLLFGFADSNLDTISFFRYRDSTTANRNGYGLVYYQGSYFIAGFKSVGMGYTGGVTITKVDSIGQVIWESYFHQYLGNKATSITVLSNGNLMLGCVRNTLNTFTQEHANTWLLEVDTGGNFVRQWFDPSDSTYSAEGLKQTQDGGFIYGAQKKNYQTVNDVYKTATIVKMDTNFHKEWVFEGGLVGNFTGFTDIEETATGKYIACGNYVNSQAWVVELDTNGTLIWERKFKGLTDTFPTWSLLTDIDILPDGSLVAVGQCQRLINPNQLPPQVGWFLKLDSNGCEIENCLVGIEEPQAQRELIPLKLFPNPATTEITIAADEAMLGSTLTITDITGRQVLAVQLATVNYQLSTDNFSPGLYHVFVKRGAQVMAVGKFVKE